MDFVLVLSALQCVVLLSTSFYVKVFTQIKNLFILPKTKQLIGSDNIIQMHHKVLIYRYVAKASLIPLNDTSSVMFYTFIMQSDTGVRYQNS